MLALRKDPTLIEFIKEKTEEMILYAISKNPASLSKINYQYDALCNIAVLVNPECLPHIKEHRKRECAERFIEHMLNQEIQELME